MKGSSGFYLGQPPQPRGWQRDTLEQVMAGEPVTITGAQFDSLYGFLGLVSTDPRKGDRELDIQTGYRLVTLQLHNKE